MSFLITKAFLPKDCRSFLAPENSTIKNSTINAKVRSCQQLGQILVQSLHLVICLQGLSEHNFGCVVNIEWYLDTLIVELGTRHLVVVIKTKFELKIVHAGVQNEASLVHGVANASQSSVLEAETTTIVNVEVGLAVCKCEFWFEMGHFFVDSHKA
ncbi:hypothetical protein BpHYR1_015070 [Brachionus plicatilis]|uniref:Uncharacterized protein n=1 Tax=Brachionus plicatilis TaxID=10195 RepID=A0A3M7SMV6_BRAPC|nr:hypothetical protein BpHYR1_015070 [Brachionus plicatilis]